MNRFHIFLILIGFFSSEMAFGQYHIQNIIPASGGECNGAIEIAVDEANAPHTFQWSKEAETGSDISNLCPGIYAVVIEDTYGCSWELEAEVPKVDGCYIAGEIFQSEIIHVCEDNEGSILIVPNTSTDYEYLWTPNVGNTAYVGQLTAGTYSVKVSDASDADCFVELSFTVETRTDCGPEPPVDSIPIFVNEAFNGLGSQGEFVELVVQGDGTCTPVDLRGYIIDDNNGDFSNLNHGICGTGFSGGHIRFKYIARWAAVPPGSKIVLYNPAAKNGAIPADDPIDENGDGLYVLSVTNNGLEGTHKYPSYSNPYYFDETMETTYGDAKWSYIALKDEKDAIQIRYPDGSYCHGFSYGSSDFMNGGPADLLITAELGINEVLHFNDGDVNEVTSFGVASTATPATANSSENEAFLNTIACVGGSLIINEVTNGIGDSTAYVELLVTSNGNCGTVDIRGYLLDDNNGNFSESLAESGISPGHLRFPDADTWEHVPGGSLIVIYRENYKHPSIGADDPDDTKPEGEEEDGDGVYILPASQLEGSGDSPTPTKPYTYDLNGTYSVGSWDYVQLYGYGDAMQVLAPDGGYQHGISYSSLGYVNGGPDKLLVDAANNKNGKVYFFNDSRACLFIIGSLMVVSDSIISTVVTFPFLSIHKSKEISPLRDVDDFRDA